MQSSMDGDKSAKPFTSRLILQEMEAGGAWPANSKRHSKFSISLFLLDCVLITAVFSFFAWLNTGDFIWNFDLEALAFIITFLVTATAAVGGYSRRITTETTRYVSEYLLGAASAIVCAIIVIFLVFGDIFISLRIAIVATMAISPVIGVVIRFMRLKIMRKHMRSKAIIVIGDGVAREKIDNWMTLKKTSYRIYYAGSHTALIDSSMNKDDMNMTGATIENAIVKLGDELEAVVIADRPENLSVKFLNRLVAINFNTLPVYTLESFYAREWQVVPLSTLSSHWALNEGFSLSQNEMYSRIKRAYDVLLSGVALLVLSPLLVFVALAIMLDSRGSAIFKQTRVGLNERKFTIYKFRTMRVGSENGSVYTSNKDARITRIGCFLRKTRIDELPQLINVLKGDMSLVGPRAEWEKLVSNYENAIPYYHFRHLVKPGITGWAQVNYRYGSNIEDTQIKLRYDLYYVRYFSFLLDLGIMFKTVYVIVFGKGR